MVFDAYRQPGSGWLGMVHAVSRAGAEELVRQRDGINNPHLVCISGHENGLGHLAESRDYAQGWEYNGTR